jgi:hypothetical protein
MKEARKERNRVVGWGTKEGEVDDNRHRNAFDYYKQIKSNCLDCLEVAK